MASKHAPKKGALVPSVHELSRTLTRTLLELIYKRAAHNDQIPTPDAAMRQMHAQIEQLLGNTPKETNLGTAQEEFARFDTRRMEKDAHHYAVDLYYAALQPRRGAPRLRSEYLADLLALQREGLTHRQIAVKMGLGPSLESADRVRHQLRIARKRTGKN